MSIKLPQNRKNYVLDTNVLIHDPNSVLSFEEHHVIIPMTVLEELDKHKNSQSSIAIDARHAIRLIDSLLGNADTAQIQKGIPIKRGHDQHLGTLSILMTAFQKTEQDVLPLPPHLNDNKIINELHWLQNQNPKSELVLITKDINMRLKARACGIQSQDYNTDQLVNNIESLSKGYLHFTDSFWDKVKKVETYQTGSQTFHKLSQNYFKESDTREKLQINQFIFDDTDLIGKVTEIDHKNVTLLNIHKDSFVNKKAWGLKPRDIYQAMALQHLLDPNIYLVILTGSAGSGKTILALAAAPEMTMERKIYNKIIATRSTQSLDKDIGYLPGTEEEKMGPWLGAFTDNLEALHANDENPNSSIEYLSEKVPLHFKSLNYMRGRSFQQSFIIIDECQNLTPHQVKTIITRAGNGSKVVCLGNPSQIDTPYLNPFSSGLTYMIEGFKGFAHSANVHLKGVPRSLLAEYAEEHL